MSDVGTKTRKIGRGISLLEVIIAASILTVSMIALGNHVAVGFRSASRGQLEALASIICQSVIDEHVVTGNLKSSSKPQPVVGCDGWRFTLDVSDSARAVGSDHPESIRLTVNVWKEGRTAELSRLALTQIVQKGTATIPAMGQDWQAN